VKLSGSGVDLVLTENMQKILLGTFILPNIKHKKVCGFSSGLSAGGYPPIDMA